MASSRRSEYWFWSSEKLGLTGDVWRLVNSLYQGSPCSICDMRFTIRKDHNEHMDWHFKQNRELKERIKNEKRFPRTFKHVMAEINKEWGKPKIKIDKVDSRGRDGACCAVCEEKLQTYWDDEEEAWCFCDIVDMGKEGCDIFVHSKCF